MIKIENLTKSYNKKKVVNNISFEVNKGEVFALLGSNGAGKSTIIKIILKLVKKDFGNIQIPQNADIGYSPETPYFPPFLTAMEVLEYYAKLQKLSKKDRKNQCEKLLMIVGLTDGKIKIKHFSKGMLQRLALAQSLLGNPDILLLDEPCAGLDAMGRIEMIALIDTLKKAGKTIIINSHILSDLEKICDRGVIMKDGYVLKKFSKEELSKEQDLEALFVEVVTGGAAC